DRYLPMQTVGAPQLWPRLVAALARPELAQDPRFATPLARREHWPALRAIIGEWLDRFKTVEEALDALQAARIPGAPVLTPPEVAAHPHLSARDAFPAVPHPTLGAVRVTATPGRLDPDRVKRYSPRSACRPGRPAPPITPGESATSRRSPSGPER